MFQGFLNGQIREAQILSYFLVSHCPPLNLYYRFLLESDGQYHRWLKNSTKIAIINALHISFYIHIMSNIDKAYFIKNRSFADNFWQVMQTPRD